MHAKHGYDKLGLPFHSRRSSTACMHGRARYLRFVPLVGPSIKIHTLVVSWSSRDPRTCEYADAADSCAPNFRCSPDAKWSAPRRMRPSKPHRGLDPLSLSTMHKVLASGCQLPLPSRRDRTRMTQLSLPNHPRILMLQHSFRSCCVCSLQSSPRTCATAFTTL
jgi:hypothetical protein